MNSCMRKLVNYSYISIQMSSLSRLYYLNYLIIRQLRDSNQYGDTM